MVTLRRSGTDSRGHGRARQEVEDADGEPLGPLRPHHCNHSLRDQDVCQCDPYGGAYRARQHGDKHSQEANTDETEHLIAEEAQKGAHPFRRGPGRRRDPLRLSYSNDESGTDEQGQCKGDGHEEQEGEHLARKQAQSARLAHQQVAQSSLGPFRGDVRGDHDERDRNDQ